MKHQVDIDQKSELSCGIARVRNVYFCGPAQHFPTDFSEHHRQFQARTSRT